MKRLLFNLFLSLFALTALADGDICYFFMHDGSLHAFYKAEIDSVVYSHYTLDSLYCREPVVQEVWSGGKACRMPLELIDSVTFERPEPIYRNDVKEMTNEMMDYVISVDDMTAHYSFDTPADLLPKVGDVLVHGNPSTMTDEAFAGRVSSIERSNGSYAVSCDSVGLGDVFKRFVCYGRFSVVKDPERASQGRRAQAQSKFHKTASASARRALAKAGTADNNDDTAPGGGGGEAWDDEEDFSWVEDGFDSGDVGLGNFTMKHKLKLPYNTSLTLSGSVGFTTRLTINCNGDEDGDDDDFFMEIETVKDNKFSLTAALSAKYETPDPDYLVIDVKELTLEGDAEKGVWGVDILNIPCNIPATPFFFDMKYGAYFKAEAKGDLSLKWSTSKKEITTLTFHNGKWTSKDNSDTDEDEYKAPGFSMQGSGSVSAGFGGQAKFAIHGATKFFKLEAAAKIGPQLNGEIKYDISEAISNDGTAYSALKSSSLKVGIQPNVSVTMTLKFFGLEWNSTLLDISPQKMWFEQEGFLLPEFTDLTYNRYHDMFHPERGGILQVAFKNSRATLFCQNGVEVIDETGKSLKQWDEFKWLERSGSKWPMHFTFEGLDFSKHRYRIQPRCRMFGIIPFNCEGETMATCPDSDHPHLIDLGLPSGTLWACCNVEADTPYDNGCYYQWGYAKTRTDYADDYTPHVNLTSIKGTRYDAATANMGDAFYTPSHDQFRELVDHTTAIDAPYECGSYGTYYVAENNNYIFLPMAGFMQGKDVVDEEKAAYYLVSNHDPEAEANDHVVSLRMGHTVAHTTPDHYGYSVRPVDGTRTGYNITAEPAAIDFGYVRSGEMASAIVTVSNSGTESGFVRCQSPEEIAFYFDDDDAAPCVPVKGSIDYPIHFAPTFNGDYTSEARIAISGSDKYISIPVSGKCFGEFPTQLSVSPTLINFGEMTLGEEKTASFTISNVGQYLEQVKVDVSRYLDISLEDGYIMLEPGETKTIEVTYLPYVVPEVCPMITLTAPSFEGCSMVVMTDAQLVGDAVATVDLGLPSGTLWAACNLGANEPQEGGYFFSWGNTEPAIDWLSPNSRRQQAPARVIANDECISLINGLYELSPLNDAATQMLGDFMIPTKEQYDELITGTTRELITYNGVQCCRLTSKTNGRSIFLPLNGYVKNGYNWSRGKNAFYWTSTGCSSKETYISSGTNPDAAAYLYCWASDYISILPVEREEASSIRPVKAGVKAVKACDVDPGMWGYTTFEILNRYDTERVVDITTVTDDPTSFEVPGEAELRLFTMTDEGLTEVTNAKALRLAPQSKQIVHVMMRKLASGNATGSITLEFDGGKELRTISAAVKCNDKLCVRTNHDEPIHDFGTVAPGEKASFGMRYINYGWNGEFIVKTKVSGDSAFGESWFGQRGFVMSWSGYAEKTWQDTTVSFTPTAPGNYQGILKLQVIDPWAEEYGRPCIILLKGKCE